MITRAPDTISTIPPNYVRNTGDTDENQAMVQNQIAIDNHVEYLGSVKGFIRLSTIIIFTMNYGQ